MANMDRRAFLLAGNEFVGRFFERDYGKSYQFSKNPEPFEAPRWDGHGLVTYDHLVWVSADEALYAHVGENVAYVIEEGPLNWEPSRWSIEDVVLFGEIE